MNGQGYDPEPGEKYQGNALEGNEGQEKKDHDGKCHDPTPGHEHEIRDRHILPGFLDNDLHGPITLHQANLPAENPLPRFPGHRKKLILRKYPKEGLHLFPSSGNRDGAFSSQMLDGYLMVGHDIFNSR